MDSKEEVIRGLSYGGSLWRQPWPELPQLQPIPTIVPSIYYLHALGVVAARYNSLELYFVHLVGATLGLKGKKITSAFTHVGAVTLIEILTTTAAEEITSGVVRDELVFAGSLFNRNRINRNFLVHSASEASDVFPHPRGMLLTKTTARKKVNIDHYRLPIDVLRRAADEIHDATAYFSLLIGSWDTHEIGKPIQLPDRPPLPENLPEFLPKDGMFAFPHPPRPPQEGR